ncbi:MAG TPA: hypothetical protein VFE19_03250 [Jatrophihabitantaceae bacterium]|nr:hypothetical protein [Jatrophihabitantaceae bacterium]
MTMIWRRGTRSATTPPTSRHTTSGSAYAASTALTADASWVRRVTNTPIATMTSASPKTLAL